MSAQRLVGVGLIVLGVALMSALQAGVGAEAIPLVIGAAFLVAYAVSRRYGLLIPGAILVGLGSGIVVSAAGGPDSSPVLGLGLGFLAIAVVDGFVRGRGKGSWWPFVPGGILTVLGLSAMPATQELVRYLVPASLVVVGLVLILGGRGAGPGATDPPSR